MNESAASLQKLLHGAMAICLGVTASGEKLTRVNVGIGATVGMDLWNETQAARQVAAGRIFAQATANRDTQFDHDDAAGTAKAQDS